MDTDEKPLAASLFRLKKVTLWEWIIAVILVLLLGYFSFEWAMKALIRHKPEVQVPDIRGKSLRYAIEQLSVSRCPLIKDSDEFNDTLPDNTIIRVTPLPGTMVKEGKVIHVVLSKGGEKLFVPDLLNKSLRLVELNLRQANLALGEVSEKYSIAVPKGNVMSQDPHSGEVIGKNELINLVISSGEPPADMVLMPDFTGKNIIEAKDWAEKKGISIGSVAKDPYTPGPAGQVLRQTPEPDTVMENKRRIEFVVGVSSKTATGTKTLYYALPQGSGKKKVLVEFVYNNIPQIILQDMRLPGSKIEVPYPNLKGGIIKIYIDGIVVNEREVK